MQSAPLIQTILPLALFFIMLGVGMSLRPADFKLVFKQPRAVLLGVGCQLMLLPLLGVLTVVIFQLPPVLAVGIMILTFAPGGATSNMITYLARGDTALSVCMTGITGLITPFSIPLLSLLAVNLLLDEQQIIAFPVVETILKLLLISLLPAVLGAIINQKWPRFCLSLQKAVKIVACTFLLLVVLGIVKANWERLPELIMHIGPVVLLLVSMAMALGYLIAARAGLSGEQGLTLSIEVGIQNAAVALLVTGGILQNAEMSASALIYGVLMNIPAFALIAYRNWPLRRTKDGVIS